MWFQAYRAYPHRAWKAEGNRNCLHLFGPFAPDHLGSTNVNFPHRNLNWRLFLVASSHSRPGGCPLLGALFLFFSARKKNARGSKWWFGLQPKRRLECHLRTRKDRPNESISFPPLGWGWGFVCQVGGDFRNPKRDRIIWWMLPL